MYFNHRLDENDAFQTSDRERPVTHKKIAPDQLKKRIFICCDGTWNDGVNNSGPATNVARFARCIKSVADDGYLQLVYYDNGVGNGTDKFSQFVDGMTGRGESWFPFYSHSGCELLTYWLAFWLTVLRNFPKDQKCVQLH